jgi:hypothetical protein
MLLPVDTMIAEEKLTKYLLVLLPKDDKSQFLQKAGYTLNNWQELEADLRSQILSHPAQFLEKTTYGDKYKIEARLKGINGIELEVTTIWMIKNQQAKFVTLVPKRFSDRE